VIIGENHSFDNVYATHQAKPGETIENLLSLGIVNADGTPGPNSAIAKQFSVNTVPSTYFLSVDPTIR
jgi:phospholipase C